MYMSNTHDEAKLFDVYSPTHDLFIFDVVWVNEETGYLAQRHGRKIRIYKGDYTIVARDGSDRRPSH